MFGFKLWSDFAVFREPLTITQNLTFSIPPKTTVGGILAAILGIDYNEYFNDDEYFNFKYSLVLNKEIRKKSFAQNYIGDYTEKSSGKITAITDYNKWIKKLNDSDKKGKKANDIIKKIQKNFINKFPTPKPIFRELLINPEYLIFINNFKYENEIIHYLKNHLSKYNIYVGNSEFAANYKYIECQYQEKIIDKLDSFTSQTNNICFEPDKKYTNLYVATKTTENRTYKDYRNLVVSDKSLLLKEKIKGVVITTDIGVFNCDFI